eukprot:TRINITY_DN17583_c0_g1_i1.p1 TRINITY_DN17583_c0_g1~~TRINITY_DN17583_c0_g1_i1.p1  ORF type:complete len:344 (-),score=60.92 TRINITY_DN17583_c0_g1_i1:411-1442(-)
MDDDWDDGYVERPKFRLASARVEDMEEEEKPPLPGNTTIAVCSSVAVVLLGCAIFTSGLPQFLLIWLAGGLLLGPHAPSSATGGDCRVGVGEPLPEPEPEEEVAPKNVGKSAKPPRRPNSGTVTPVETASLPSRGSSRTSSANNLSAAANGDAAASTDAASAFSGWTAKEIETLQKAMVKNPKGTARRWEIIAQVFKGNKSMEDVVSTGKLLTDRKGPSDNDPYATFLAQRKGSGNVNSPLTLRDEGAPVADSGSKASGGGGGSWTDELDRRLMGALKKFPRETSARWDRISEAVGDRSKQQCFRRFSEMREGLKAKRAAAAAAKEQGGEGEAANESEELLDE